MGRLIFALALALLALLSGCSPGKYILKETESLEHQFQDHVGFMVYDPASHKTLIQHHAGGYFTPASNTKIFTFMAGLQVLGDSIPGLHYVVRGDSLIFQGTGDPSFLYSEVFQNGRVFNFLKNASQQLYLSATNYKAERFGPGWSWDDYNYSYSAERSAFPLYGNCLSFHRYADNTFRVVPPYFAGNVRISPMMEAEAAVSRDDDSNLLHFIEGADTTEMDRQIPFRYSPTLAAQLLSDTLGRAVVEVNSELGAHPKILYSIPSDSLYRVMLQESDNFIAEQLLLMVGGILSDTLSQETAIQQVKMKYLFDLPDKPVWVDGSGLSRYNLFTPRSIVRLWEKIYTLVPRERLFSLVAIGGKTGTLTHSYRAEPPFIYGKTGTLSNNHCLSGFLITKKGKTLIFSLMNNNYTVPTAEVRKSMERILTMVRDRY